jgi:hypothetical protein
VSGPAAQTRPEFANLTLLQVAGINEAEQKIAFALYYWVGIGGFAHKNDAPDDLTR